MPASMLFSNLIKTRIVLCMQNTLYPRMGAHLWLYNKLHCTICIQIPVVKMVSNQDVQDSFARLISQRAAAARRQGAQRSASAFIAFSANPAILHELSNA
jgi:hypothetical protein